MVRIFKKTPSEEGTVGPFWRCRACFLRDCGAICGSEFFSLKSQEKELKLRGTEEGGTINLESGEWYESLRRRRKKPLQVRFCDAVLGFSVSSVFQETSLNCGIKNSGINLMTRRTLRVSAI